MAFLIFIFLRALKLSLMPNFCIIGHCLKCKARLPGRILGAGLENAAEACSSSPPSLPDWARARLVSSASSTEFCFQMETSTARHDRRWNWPWLGSRTEVGLSRQPRDLRGALVTPLDQMLDYLEKSGS